MRRLARLTPLVAVAAAGCFATSNDVKLLQAHIDYLQQTVETSKADADKARIAQWQRDSSLAMAIRQLAALDGGTRDSLRTLADSVRYFMDQFSRFKADVALADSQSAQMSYKILEMMGLNQTKIAELQAGFESARERASIPTPGDTSGKAGTPGPRQLYQLGMTQLQNSRPDNARDVFLEFIATYPNDKLLPDAVYQLAESYAKGGNDGTADSVYKSVVERFPNSNYAPNALWKRAEALRKAGQPKAADALYKQIITDYPRSDVVRQARDRLKPPPQ